MPQVPRYGSSDVAPQTGLPFQRLQDQAGESASRFGTEVASVGGMLADHAIKMQEIDTETQWKAADAQLFGDLTKAYYDPEHGFGTLQQKNAMDAAPGALQSAQDRAREIASGLNPVAARMFSQSSTVRLNSFSQQVFAHTADQRQTYIKAISSSRIDVAAQAAMLNYNDPQFLNQFMSINRSELESQGRQSGAPADAVDAAVRAGQSKVLRGIALQLEIDRPGAGKAFFDQHRGLMTGEDALQVGASLDQQQQQQDVAKIGLAATQNGGGALSEMTAAAQIRSVVPGVTITSQQRTPEHNRAVGGVPNSQHISGTAMDVVPPRGQTTAQLAQNLRARGLPGKFIDEGDHVHWQWGGATAPATPDWAALHDNPEPVLARAAQMAEASHPGDAVFASQAQSHALRVISEHYVSAQQVNATAYSAINQQLLNGKPTSQDTLLNTPELREAWMHLSSDQQRAVNFNLSFNTTLNAQGQPTGNNLPVGPGINPTDAGQRAALDQQYQIAMAGFTPQDRYMRGVQFASQAGVVPASMQGDILAGLRSTNPQVVVSAATAIQQLRNANPNLTHDFGDAMGTADQIVGLVSAGSSPADAVAAMQELSRQAGPATGNVKAQFAAERQSRSKGGNLTTAFDDDLLKAFGAPTHGPGIIGYFTGPGTAVQDSPGFVPMRADFLYNLQQQYIRNGGSMDAAIATATNNIHAAWGLTSMNGRTEFMRHAPERMYGDPNLPDSENSAWMREQLLNEIGTNAMLPEGWQDTVTIKEATAVTQPNQLPLYHVYVGPQIQVERDGVTPKLWHPDLAAHQRQANDAAIAAARQEREINIIAAEGIASGGGQ